MEGFDAVIANRFPNSLTIRQIQLLQTIIRTPYHHRASGGYFSEAMQAAIGEVEWGTTDTSFLSALSDQGQQLVLKASHILRRSSWCSNDNIVILTIQRRNSHRHFASTHASHSLKSTFNPWPTNFLWIELERLIHRSALPLSVPMTTLRVWCFETSVSGSCWPPFNQALVLWSCTKLFKHGAESNTTKENPPLIESFFFWFPAPFNLLCVHR